MAYPPRVKNPEYAARYGKIRGEILGLANGTLTTSQIAKKVQCTENHVRNTVRSANKILGYTHYVMAPRNYKPIKSFVPLILTTEQSAWLQSITPDGATVAETVSAIITDAMAEEINPNTSKPR